jgi:hypothetical protein
VLNGDILSRENDGKSIEQLCDEWRETALQCLKSDNADERNTGIRLLLKACYDHNDFKSGFILYELILEGKLCVSNDKGVLPAQEAAFDVLRNMAGRGSVRASKMLSSLCFERYYHDVQRKILPSPNGPLTDFEGKQIRINRKGIRTPVDAVLEYVDGVNRLTLSANLYFAFCDELPNVEDFIRAIYDGILLWEGDYRVFGNQKLEVRIKLTEEARLTDSIKIIPVTESVAAVSTGFADLIGSKKVRERTYSLINDKRSFATYCIRRWRVTAPRFIYIMSEDGKFDDYEEIKHVVKHEFGHVLGLGDLYRSVSDKLPGVKKGSFAELDSFHIKDNDFYLVMCDHHGTVSNNDIEMVVLAFWKNRMQFYQRRGNKDEISEALGNGN